MTIVERQRRLDDQLQRLLADADRARRGSRRDGEELRPLGPKAARTRAAIIEAGIEVFCDQGYATSSVADVHGRAGVSLGTFYQYFRDKSDLVITIVAEHVLEVSPRLFPTFEADRGVEGSMRVVSGFVRHYARTADFQRVWEEVTHLESEAADFRHRMAELIEASLATAFAFGQRAGTVDASLDSQATARALAAMVDRTCYLTFVVDGAGRDAVVETSRTLAALWTNALRVPPPG